MNWLKKIISSEHNAIQKTLESKNGLKITSIVIAVVMFITINQVGNPIWMNYFVATGYIEAVPLTVKYDTNKYVVSGVPQTINVNINGTENNVQSVLKSKENLMATLSLNYKGSGTYSISSEQIKYNNTANVKITPTISDFEINVQDKTEETRSVDISYINGDNNDNGFILDTPTLSTKAVTINGGINDISKVVSVRGTIDLNDLNTSRDQTKQKFNVELTPYDSEGQVVSNVSVSPKSIEVNQSYEISTKEVPIEFIPENNDDDEYLKALCSVNSEDCKKVEQQKVKIYGERDKIDETNYVEYQLDFSSYDADNHTMNIAPNLESGIYVTSDTPSKVAVQKSSGVEKTLEDVPIKIKNKKDNLNVTNELTTDVKLIGDEKVLSKIKPDDLNIYVNLKGVDSAGTEKINLNVENTSDYNIYLPSYDIDVSMEKE